MKTFSRLLRRYLLAAVGIVLLMFVLGTSFLGWVLWREWQRPKREYSYSNIADSMVQTADGLAFGPQHTPEEWMDGYSWAMVLDADGRVIWSYALPRTLDRRYTSSDVARFSRWYLDDYPVFCWTEDYGLFVAGTEPGSMWKYTVYTSPGMLTDIAGFLLPCLLGMLAAGLAVCFLLSWRGARELLALARRDNARTRWIAGVSHDVRTPLALILGWAEQLEQDAALPAPARQKAGGIRTQSERLRTLIDDLNLTSKLQYGAQPLRRELLTVGPLLRQLVAQFCDSPLADQCDLSLTQTLDAEQAQISADPALLGRLVENLLSNSVRHNPQPVTVCLCAEVRSRQLCLTFTDDGVGYPPAVLAALKEPESSEDAPHILGLHVVEQIAAAHGADAIFIPEPASMYAEDHATWVEVPDLSRIMCGLSRPTHFRGVCTVVLKLFMITQADVAVFGQKDWQQQAILRRMVRDLNVPVRIETCPIVREEDGLALSSRNVYLTEEERRQAPWIHRGLQLARDMAQKGQTHAKILREAALCTWADHLTLGRLDYLSVVDPVSMEPLDTVDGPALMACAIRMGKARLIDNILLRD